MLRASGAQNVRALQPMACRRSPLSIARARHQSRWPAQTALGAGAAPDAVAATSTAGGAGRCCTRKDIPAKGVASRVEVGETAPQVLRRLSNGPVALREHDPRQVRGFPALGTARRWFLVRTRRSPPLTLDVAPFSERRVASLDPRIPLILQKMCSNDLAPECRSRIRTRRLLPEQRVAARVDVQRQQLLLGLGRLQHRARWRDTRAARHADHE